MKQTLRGESDQLSDQVPPLNIAWRTQNHGDFGVAEQLSKSKNTSISGLVAAGILLSRAGKVRLWKPEELPPDWDPATDKRLMVWEMVHQLVRALETDGEGAAATLAARLGSRAETAREFCYRLYTLCERKNGPMRPWPTTAWSRAGRRLPAWPGIRPGQRIRPENRSRESCFHDPYFSFLGGEICAKLSFK